MPIRLLAVAAYPDVHQASYLSALAACPEMDLRVLYAVPPAATPREADSGPLRVPDDLEFGRFAWSVVEDLHQVGDGRDGFSAISAPRFRKQLERESPDALLVLGWRSRVLVQAARAGRRSGLPVLLREASNDLLRRSWWQRLRLRLRLRIYSAFLAVGRANRRLYERAGVPPDRIFAAPNAVDNAAFAAAAETLRPRRQELRRNWSLSGDDFCLLFVGSFERKKRLLDLFEALERARTSRNDLRLLMVGDGELGPALRARAHERRLPVTFAGKLSAEELPRVYAAADVLVLSSDARETWGLEVNEAMASGLPGVVSSDVGCREDLVEDGITGFSYPVGDTSALASCLTSLAADPVRAASMGQTARERVVADYSFSRAVRGTLEALGQSPR